MVVRYLQPIPSSLAVRLHANCPSTHKISLAAWQVSVQNFSARNRKNHTVILVLRMNVSTMTRLTLLMKHPNDDSKKHGNRW